VGAAHDLIQSEKNGFIVPAGDATALAQAMRRLVASPELRATFARASAEIAARLAPDETALFWEEIVATFGDGK
jgi:glycosyltransferase involved in cell wall biosynthesis